MRTMHDSLPWLTLAEVPRLAAEPKLLPKGLWKNFGLKTGTVVSSGNV